MNSGSSSLKFALYQIGKGADVRVAAGAIDGIGLSPGHLTAHEAARGTTTRRAIRCPDAGRAGRIALETLERFALPAPDAAGHRVVHGGLQHASPERVTPKLLAALRRLIPLAPLHQPGGILGIEAVAAARPGVPQVACFDTAFHRRLPENAQRLPLPRASWDEGIRRYGFHGLSYESVLQTLGRAGHGRVVIAHLGNGASVAAVQDGQPMETTMGFTPAGGVMMGTRSGDLDPGLLVYLRCSTGWISWPLQAASVSTAPSSAGRFANVSLILACGSTTPGIAPESTPSIVAAAVARYGSSPLEKTW